MRAVLAAAAIAPLCAVVLGCAPTNSSRDTTSRTLPPMPVTSTSVSTRVTTPPPVPLVRTPRYDFTVAVRYGAWLEIHNACRTSVCQERARQAFPDVAHNPAARIEYVRSQSRETVYSTPQPVTSRITKTSTSVTYPDRAASPSATLDRDDSPFAGALPVVGGLLGIVVIGGVILARRRGGIAPRHAAYVTPHMTLDDLSADPDPYRYEGQQP